MDTYVQTRPWVHCADNPMKIHVCFWWKGNFLNFRNKSLKSYVFAYCEERHVFTTQGYAEAGLETKNNYWLMLHARWSGNMDTKVCVFHDKRIPHPWISPYFALYNMYWAIKDLIISNKIDISVEINQSSWMATA